MLGRALLQRDPFENVHHSEMLRQGDFAIRQFYMTDTLGGLADMSRHTSQQDGDPLLSCSSSLYYCHQRKSIARKWSLWWDTGDFCNYFLLLTTCVIIKQVSHCEIEETWHVALLIAMGQAGKPSPTPATPHWVDSCAYLHVYLLLYTEALQEAQPQGLEPRT